MKYNHTLDTSKGILILLVILGHILSGGALTGYIKYAIYSFHMPLFFGISGFMLKKELFYIPFTDLTKKYFYRLLIPFIFAYVVYSLIEGQLLDTIYPWFHLWFIPAFLLFLLYLYAIVRLNIHLRFMLVLLFIFSAFWIGNYGFSGEVKTFYLIGDKRFYYDFVFFYLGYYLRNHLVLSNKNYLLLWALFIFSAVYIWVLNNTVQINFEYSLIWIFFNLSMIYLVLLGSLKYQTIKLPLVTWMGTMSLPIYLLHIIPLLLLKPLVENGVLSPSLLILLYFTGVTIIMVIIYITKNTNFGKMLILGERIAMSGTKQ